MKQPEWQPLDLGPLVVEVLNTPLDDGLSCTPISAQQRADREGAALLTPKLADLWWLAADVRIAPQTQPVGFGHHTCPGCGKADSGPWALCSTCGARHRYELECKDRDDKLRALGPMNRDARVAGWGKPWALAASCFRVAGRVGQPYGWHCAHGGFAGVTSGVRVLQPCSPTVAPHDGHQLDYAEPWRGWRPVGRTFAEVWRDHLAVICHDHPPTWRLPID